MANFDFTVVVAPLSLFLEVTPFPRSKRQLVEVTLSPVQTSGQILAEPAVPLLCLAHLSHSPSLGTGATNLTKIHPEFRATFG